ncbi:MAG TPA: hypothetical protein VHP63_04230 [candidate division Zixibacteria bacterium]|nr:hypothetical protein [candidate division Zixibacteria bacterium]
MPLTRYQNQMEKAYLIGLAPDSRKKEEISKSLEELKLLALSTGTAVIGQRVQVRPRPDSHYFVGKGLVEEIKIEMSKLGGTCVIFDDTLSPAQQRNLEEAFGLKVIDRPILI